jgi:hypothetical protein
MGFWTYILRQDFRLDGALSLLSSCCAKEPGAASLHELDISSFSDVLNLLSFPG